MYPTVKLGALSKREFTLHFSHLIIFNQLIFLSGTNKISDRHTLQPPNHPTLPNKTGIGTTGPLSGRARIKQMMVCFIL